MPAEVPHPRPLYAGLLLYARRTSWQACRHEYTERGPSHTRAVSLVLADTNGLSRHPAPPWAHPVCRSGRQDELAHHRLAPRRLRCLPHAHKPTLNSVIDELPNKHVVLVLMEDPRFARITLCALARSSDLTSPAGATYQIASSIPDLTCTPPSALLSPSSPAFMDLLCGDCRDRPWRFPDIYETDIGLLLLRALRGTPLHHVRYSKIGPYSVFPCWLGLELLLPTTHVRQYATRHTRHRNCRVIMF